MTSKRAGRFDELPEGGAIRVVMDDGVPVAVFKCGGALYATGDTCSHEEASLSEGEIDTDEFSVECPKHGAEFDIRTGKNRTLPATQPVPSFTVKVEGGDIYVESK
ncbi:MAG: bifunctional 3-phenylpropionate/cinnamic acid dioxygenase ferredoxin subunit [Actinomycetota bacterium]